MSKASLVVRLGTRGSTLARWQTDHVAELLHNAHTDLKTEIEVFSTRGDEILDKPLPQIGGKGLFTAELEAALHEHRIDMAVHSLKDLPTESPSGLIVGGIPMREDVADVLVSRGGLTLDNLPKGAVIGTSSRRRIAQLKHYRPDLQVLDIRGNVETRIRKALDPTGPYDATVLAYAGLKRLGKADVITQILPLDILLPAPGQGALGIQCRDEEVSEAILRPINDFSTLLAVTAERTFLAGLGGGCAVPIGAYGSLDDELLTLQGRVVSLDGTQFVEVAESIYLEGNTPISAAIRLGESLSRVALERGAQAILESVDA